MNQKMDETQSKLSGKDLSLLTYIGNYWKHKRLFYFFIFLMQLLAVLYIIVTPIQYEIKASIAIKDQKKGETAEQSILKDLEIVNDNRIVDNEVEILKSNNLFRRIVGKNQLNISYFKKKWILFEEELYKNSPIKIVITDSNLTSGQKFKISIINDSSFKFSFGSIQEEHKFNELIIGPYFKFKVEKNNSVLINVLPSELIVKVETIEAKSESISSSISINQPSKSSSIVFITTKSNIKNKGLDIINYILAEYENTISEEKEIQTKTTLSYMDDRLASIKNKMDQIENDAQSYKSQRSITNINFDTQFYLDELKDKESKKAKLQTDIQMLQSIYSSINNNSKNIMAIGNNNGINDPVLSNLINNSIALQGEKEVLLKTTAIENPLVKLKQDQLDNINSNIKSYIMNLQKSYQVELSSSKLQEQSVKGSIFKLPENEKNLDNIKREKEIIEGIYTYLLQKRENAIISNILSTSPMRIVDYAFSSDKPIWPKKGIILIVSLLLGFVIPISIINIRNVFK